VTEPVCPFCGRALDDAFRSAPSPQAPAAGRLTRAALFAIGATGLTASACGGQVNGPALQIDASVDDANIDDATFATDSTATVTADGNATAAADGNTTSPPGDGGSDGARR
jgi:hypothetical protein